MPRPRNPTLMAAWKLYMPAPLTARVEMLLLDPSTNKPRHGERARLTGLLWEEYLARMSGSAIGDQVIIPLPQLPHAIYEFEGVRFSYNELRSRLHG